MESHGIFHHVENHSAQQVTEELLREFDYVLAMDRRHLRLS